MNSLELKKWIDSLLQDIEFSYLGKDGAICPFSRDNISVIYDGVNKDYTSIDDVMSDPFYNGNCLNDISEDLIIY